MINLREFTDIFPWLQDERLALLTWIAIVVVVGWILQRVLFRAPQRSGPAPALQPVAAGEPGAISQSQWDAFEAEPAAASAPRASLTRRLSMVLVAVLVPLTILFAATALAIIVDPAMPDRLRGEFGLSLPVLDERSWLVVFGICVLFLGWLAQRGLASRRRSGGGLERQTANGPAAHFPARWVTSDQQREELDFARDAEAALHQAPSRGSAVFISVMLAMLASFFGWAYFAEIEEVTRGEGRVIPSSKTQIVQSLEGGIVKGILVAQGDAVKKGQILLRIDDTGFSSNLGELEAKAISLKAQIARLRIEASNTQGSRLEFPDGLAKQAPEIIANETNLFQIRRISLDNQVNVLGDRLEQKQLELAELRETAKRLENSLSIAKEEHDIKAPLAERGIIPKTDLLRLEREISELEGRLSTTETSIPRAEAAIREAERLAEERTLEFRQTAQVELNTRLSELSVVEQSLRGAADRVDRTEIRSPADGVVNKLHVNTLGGVVRASEPLVEITPLEDNLLVEVRVQPKDIAFISPGQNALVKLSAYDFTIYGGLDGKVEIISADSTIDEAARDSYYLVTVRALESSLKTGAESLPILPGMVATVDIITGNKSILDYLLKPIVKARHEALRER